MTLHLVGTNFETGHIPTSRLDTQLDYGHTWHPDSHETQKIGVAQKRFPSGLLKMIMECYRLQNWGGPGPQNSLDGLFPPREQASNRGVQSKVDSRDEVTANEETNQGQMDRVNAQLRGDPN
ncbi:unnamed protein product [Malus baccata var. baccata]